jgi:hypothetical protein
VLHDLDQTLEVLLKRELPAPLVQQVTISFAAPDAEFPPPAVTLPAIDFFLYDVRENWELRTNDWVTERTNLTAVRHPPPVRVECSYLVTAWASKNVPDPAQDEHRLLGEVITVLLRHRRIPAEVLQGSLQDQEPPVRTSALQATRLQSLGEFWQALGGKPKAAAHYAVTISVPSAPPVDAGPLVLEKVMTGEPPKGTGG